MHSSYSDTLNEYICYEVYLIADGNPGLGKAWGRVSKYERIQDLIEPGIEEGAKTKGLLENGRSV